MLVHDRRVGLTGKNLKETNGDRHWGNKFEGPIGVPTWGNQPQGHQMRHHWGTAFGGTPYREPSWWTPLGETTMGDRLGGHIRGQLENTFGGSTWANQGGPQRGVYRGKSTRGFPQGESKGGSPQSLVSKCVPTTEVRKEFSSLRVSTTVIFQAGVPQWRSNKGGYYHKEGPSGGTSRGVNKRMSFRAVYNRGSLGGTQMRYLRGARNSGPPGGYTNRVPQYGPLEKLHRGSTRVIP
jgi:hypothetical protein